MRHARALLPYALASVAIVVMSAGALGMNLVTATPTAPDPSPSVGRAELSDAGRLSFWRAASSTEMELWVGDLDGRRQWPLLRERIDVSITSTRWSPDGSAIAYVRGNTSLVVVRTDGQSVMLPLPADLVKAGRRIVSYEWSRDATRIAVTLRPAGGASRESDVFVVEARARSPWTRLTQLGDAVAGKWISDDELFVETASGMIAVADVDGLALRPITGMPAASPALRNDGRVYFTGGGWVSADLAGGPWGSGTVWSATIDGDDLRREATVQADQIRIQGRLADGRFVLGVPGSTYVAGDSLVPMPWRAGTVRRVVVSEDGRQAIGITDSRVVRLEMSKVPHTNDVPAPADAVSTLLDGVRDADVWFPSSAVTPARAPTSAASGPPARLAFTLGRILWELGRDGALRQIAPAPEQGWLGGVTWSPAGDRLAVLVGEAVAMPNTSVVVLGPAGEIWRTDPLSSPTVSWSPDGKGLAISSISGEQLLDRITQLFDAETGVPGSLYDGAEAQWTPAGLILLGEGTLHPVERHPVDQSVDLLRDAARTRITDARRLSSHPKLRDIPGTGKPAMISQVQPSADGRLLGVWLYRIQGNGYSQGVFAVLRTSDGEPVSVYPFEPRVGIQDLTWSPASALMGRTLWQGSGPTAARRAQIVDALDGRVVLEQPGSFAGWAPDGDWFYVARDEGLFAYPLTGGEGVRISSFGVKVVATRP